MSQDFFPEFSELEIQMEIVRMERALRVREDRKPKGQQPSLSHAERRLAKLLLERSRSL